MRAGGAGALAVVVSVVMLAPTAARAGAQSAPESRPESSPALTLRGQLVDSSGAALVGVEVTAVPAPPAVARQAVTDAHGVFTLVGLPPGEVQLRIAHAASLPTPHPARVRVERGIPDVQIKARALPVLRGVVVDRDLSAVGKSTVVLLSPQAQEVALETDERGAFRALVAPPKDGLLVLARNAAAGLAGSTLWTGAQEVISVPVAPQAIVSGVLRDRAGEPVAGARVWVVTAKGVRLGSGESDEKGGYRFPLLPGGMAVRIVAAVGPESRETSSEIVTTVVGQEAKLPVITVGK